MDSTSHQMLESLTNSPIGVQESPQTIAEANENASKSPNPSIRSITHYSRLKDRTRTFDSNSDVSSVTSTRSYHMITLSQLQRKWMSAASNCDYDSLVSCLEIEPQLSAYKDFTNGFTALHWAVKFGRKDIIELIAGKHAVSPDLKTHGGYTALHLAAQYQNNDIMHLLIYTYKANPDIRDHSGCKPEYYYLNKLANDTNGAINSNEVNSNNCRSTLKRQTKPSASLGRVSEWTSGSICRLKNIGRRASLGLFEASKHKYHMNSEFSSPEKLRKSESDSDSD